MIENINLAGNQTSNIDPLGHSAIKGIKGCHMDNKRTLICVGVNQHTNYPNADLKYASSDAEKVYDVLKDGELSIPTIFYSMKMQLRVTSLKL